MACRPAQCDRKVPTAAETVDLASLSDPASSTILPFTVGRFLSAIPSGAT
jgi:hypothetical protein